jgi:hypothetical protein
LKSASVDVPPAQHSLQKRPSNVSNSGICFAFQKGTCERGDTCRFSHDSDAPGIGAHCG